MRVMRYRYARFMASIHKQPGRPNWFCAYYDPEGFRRFRSTGTGNEKIATTICVNMERAAELTRQGKLTNEKALKLVRETSAAIGETHGKLAASRAESVLKPAVEEFIRIAGGEFASYTVRTWLHTWIAGRTEPDVAVGAYQRRTRQPDPVCRRERLRPELGRSIHEVTPDRVRHHIDADLHCRCGGGLCPCCALRTGHQHEVPDVQIERRQGLALTTQFDMRCPSARQTA